MMQQQRINRFKNFCPYQLTSRSLGLRSIGACGSFHKYYKVFDELDEHLYYAYPDKPVFSLCDERETAAHVIL